jgi:YHS domain-containing protein
MNFKKIHLLIGVLFAGLILFNGCKKSEPAPPPTTTGTMQGHEGHDHAATTEQTATPVAAVVEQTTCPVMGGAINKDLFTEYKGKKVYFCCPGCKEQFEKEPEKYIAKLPQFKQ